MKSITFDEIEVIINEHAEEFAEESVLGIGICQRENLLRFVVTVEDQETFDTLSEKYKDREINGFPIYVEIGTILTIDRSVDMSMDMDPWPFWMLHNNDAWWMKALLCIPITCSWLLWSIRGKDACP